MEELPPQKTLHNRDRFLLVFLANSSDILTFIVTFSMISVTSQSQYSTNDSNEHEEKFHEAVDLITESAEQGHTPAITTLGQLYELADNYKVAKQWCEYLNIKLTIY